MRKRVERYGTVFLLTRSDDGAELRVETLDGLCAYVFVNSARFSVTLEHEDAGISDNTDDLRTAADAVDDAMRLLVKRHGAWAAYVQRCRDLGDEFARLR